MKRSLSLQLELLVEFFGGDAIDVDVEYTTEDVGMPKEPIEYTIDKLTVRVGKEDIDITWMLQYEGVNLAVEQYVEDVLNEEDLALKERELTRWSDDD